MNDEERQRLLDAILDPAAQNKVIVGGPWSPVESSAAPVPAMHTDCPLGARAAMSAGCTEQHPRTPPTIRLSEPVTGASRSHGGPCAQPAQLHAGQRCSTGDVPEAA
jgi:hypothetical protein